MVLHNIFERAYIINLPERSDRRQEMMKELKGIGTDLMPGKIEFFPAVKPNDCRQFPSKGALGCYLSHLSILKKAREDNLANVLMIEDDLAISRRFKHISHELSECLEQIEWDLIFLGFFPYHGLALKDYYESESSTVCAAQRFTLKTASIPTQGTHFYVVNQRIYDQLIAFLDNLLEERLNRVSFEEDKELGKLDGAHLDTAYFLFRKQHPDIKSFIMCPNLGWQRNSRSDINNASGADASGMDKVFSDFYRRSKSLLKKNLEYINPYWFSR